MDAKKALYRAKLKEAAKKQEKPIDSPLFRFNENDQPICRVCDVVLKSESLWAAHQASRKHHEATKNLKTTAAGQSLVNDAKHAPPVELTHKPQPSSALPVDFFAKHDTKRQKTEKKMERVSPVHAVVGEKRKEAPSRQFSRATTKSGGSEVRLVKQTLLEGFFDKKDGESLRTRGLEVKQNGTPFEGFFDKDARTTKKVDAIEVEQVKGVLPEGFFDKMDTSTNQKMDGSEVKQMKGALPEGFFDNKDADLSARGIGPVKIDIKDEYKDLKS